MHPQFKWLSLLVASSILVAITAAVVPVSTPHPAGQLSKAQLMQRGQQVFDRSCAVCHQTNGKGMPPIYPALQGSAIVNGPVNVLLDRVLSGKPGTAMQPFKDLLDNNELAAVITYERNAWGNNASVVEAEKVRAARNKPAARN